MDRLTKEYIVNFFDDRLRHFGDRPEALGWIPQRQIQHYEALLDVGDLAGSRILDFGCGKGDFYQFLKERSIAVSYTGIDINEKLITLAKRKHPEADFRVMDIGVEELKEDFDYVFCCGVFNLKFQGIEDVIRDSLIKLFSRCRVALAYNALSSYTKNKEYQLHYCQPEELFRFAVTKLSPSVSLRHDRLEGDFTLFVYRDFRCK